MKLIHRGHTIHRRKVQLPQRDPAAMHAASLRCPQENPEGPSVKAATATIAIATSIRTTNLHMRGAYPTPAEG